MKRLVYLSLFLSLSSSPAFAAQAPKSVKKPQEKPKLIKHIETIASGKTFADRKNPNVQIHFAPLSTRFSFKF